ncbi:response regulator [Paraflavitalea speifideaquila]|uniref:LytR/AlgR family response regulator transcription factor n=1 Tax=Paraflavitalea speifideaquila TaxID=3076558 RepID=UPI0028EB04B3|nr:response regulator [Paraflavitalea speifideiaquila]
MIKAIIVDDEPYCCEVLSTLLERHLPEVKIEAVCHSAAEALTAIANHPVQLVFLDIEMPHMNGFQLLEQLPNIDFDLIFTTSYDQYALKAIKFSALDYLLKPIDRGELQVAVRKAINRLQGPCPSSYRSYCKTTSTISPGKPGSPAHHGRPPIGPPRFHHQLCIQQQLHHYFPERQTKDHRFSYTQRNRGNAGRFYVHARASLLSREPE